MNMAINDEAKRLTRMITEYLDITRLESGATVLRRSPVRVESLVERSLLAARSAGRAEEHPAGAPVRRANCPPSWRMPTCSRGRWAIWFRTPSSTARLETEVTVAVRAEPGGVAIEVSDQGPGIPAADLDRDI